MQPETREEVLSKINRVFDIIDYITGYTESKLDLLPFHDEIVEYIKDNYSDFDGSAEQLRKIVDFDEIIMGLWNVTRVIHHIKMEEQSKMPELYSVYRGAAPLLMGLFKEATGLKYESWYFMNDPIICEKLLKKVFIDAKRRRAPAFSIFAKYLFIKLLVYKAYSSVGEKEITRHLAPIRARIDNYLNNTKKGSYYDECPKVKLDTQEVLGLEAYDYIERVSKSLERELDKNPSIVSTFVVPHKVISTTFLQYCSTSYANMHYGLAINNPFNFDEQLPDLRSYQSIADNTVLMDTEFLMDTMPPVDPEDELDIDDDDLDAKPSADIDDDDLDAKPSADIDDDD